MIDNTIIPINIIIIKNAIKIITPHPKLNVSKKLSPFFQVKSPIIKAMIIIPINIDIDNLF